MKRGATLNSDSPAPKRTKASQACGSCRRQKSRCEILDVRPQPGAPVVIRCHRCKVLGVECSFETSDLIHFMPKTAAQTPSDASSSSPSTSQEQCTSAPERYGGLNTLAAVASSRSDAEKVTVNPIPSHYGMLPEDLVPTATTPIWGCVSRVDWTATPMLAIQELVRCPRSDSHLEISSAGRLSDILNPQEIISLLDIFETRYTPWLCAQPGPLESSNSLLDIVRCTIASRHLSLAARSIVAPRLQKLTEDIFLREIFNPQPALDSIKALLILSVWTPICGTGAEARDGRLLIASAVSMAMNLHLQDESKRAINLRADKDGLSPEKGTEAEESTQKWRLWMCLSIAESMLCVGTGRTPVSHLSPVDHDMTALSSFSHFTLSSVRDIRLGLIAKVFDVCETALKLRLQRADDLAAFFRKMNDHVCTMEAISRLLKPLPVITQHDTFYSQMLILQYHACLLLMVHHALREVRTSHERDTQSKPWYKVEMPDGHCISLFWGSKALISAEAVLTAFLATTDLSLLSTAPDNLYVMVGFAATWIFVSNFSIYQLSGSQVGGASERLQVMTIERLSQIAHAPDHAAARCGHVLSALMSAWERRKARAADQEQCEAGCFIHMPFTRAMESLDEQLRAAQVSAVPGDPHYPNPPSYQDLPGGAANSDLFMDDAFWASFVENLNSDTFLAQSSVAT
ncbi:hypothetical protein GGX14DRAFT_658803, partial [Mycena pura]